MRLSKSFTKNVRKNRFVPGSGLEVMYRDEDFFSRSTISAYHKAQVRGFQPKHKLDDWYAAEEEKT
ncbi:DUF2934 domain-containing protein [Nitrosomonas sp. Nm33]|uniref:DUF2934 domain-containing protein n=1 Tax=Nitrosomonas sp. Nm33 TaxID=133724 RepID=UPI00089C14D5|nr:DUF2934 domain-containing protein [Nitrosomonas sp. Nm33]SDY86607.1 Protein of unknown function [Nitrosomonas sp. Nm33]